MAMMILDLGDPRFAPRGAFFPCLCGDPPWFGVPAKPRRQRKPTLASVAKQACKAGLEVARYEVKPDGSIVIVTGKGEQQQGNDVDEWIAKHADKTQRH
jgi:hypothetical protein